MDGILEAARRLCAGKGEVLYLTQFGSHLYGTDTAQSDADYKGIYLPDRREMLLGRHCRSLQYTTGDDRSKNSSADMDMQLWSLHYWLELLRNGDTHALDLLFSMRAQHVPRHDALCLLERYAPTDLLDVRYSRRYVEYAHSQARKYGLKGTRMGLLKHLLRFVREDAGVQAALKAGERAGSLFPAILERFADASHCFVREAHDGPMLFVLGKGYGASVTVREMCARLQREFDKYGERVAQAEKNEGIDWKALSHAVRCLYQMLELLRTGFVRYPLEQAVFLREIKQGKLPWSEVEPLILRLLDEVNQNAANSPSNPGVQALHERVILQAYGVE